MEEPRPTYSGRKLYVAEWSSRALHGTALMMNRLRVDQDLSERQEWLYDRIIEELEWRWLEDIRVRPWQACSCLLCFSPFPTEDPGAQGDKEDDAPFESRPDGDPISRKQPRHAPRYET